MGGPGSMAKGKVAVKAASSRSDTASAARRWLRVAGCTDSSIEGKRSPWDIPPNLQGMIQPPLLYLDMSLSRRGNREYPRTGQLRQSPSSDQWPDWGHEPPSPPKPVAGRCGRFAAVHMLRRGGRYDRAATKPATVSISAAAESPVMSQVLGLEFFVGMQVEAGETLTDADHRCRPANERVSNSD